MAYSPLVLFLLLQIKRPIHLERTPIRSNDPLSPLHKPLLVPHQRPNLDNITGNRVVQNLHSLRDSHATRQKFDHIAGFEDNVRVVGFSRCPHGHGTVDQIKCACYSLLNHEYADSGIRIREKRTCVSNARVTALQTSRRYFSRYLGKSVAKDDSSVNAPALLSVGWNASTFHCQYARKLPNRGNR